MKRIVYLNLLVILLIVIGTISITEASWLGDIKWADDTNKAPWIRTFHHFGDPVQSISPDVAPWYEERSYIKDVQEGEEFPIVLQNMASGKCLDVNGGSPDNGTNVQSWGCHSGDPQRWKRREGPDGWFLLENKATRKCLDVADGGQDDGTNIQPWQCDPNNINQHWKAVDAGEGWVYLINRIVEKCLDVAGGKTDNGTNVWSWGCNQSAVQKWWLK